jgi:winged helix-turn helix protein
MAGRVRVREISDDEGNRRKRIVRRGSGSVVTWRRAQMVLWSAQGMSVAQVARLAFTSEDRVRDVLHNFNADGFASLFPSYAGGRPPVFTLAQQREIKKIAKSVSAMSGAAGRTYPPRGISRLRRRGPTGADRLRSLRRWPVRSPASSRATRVPMASAPGCR